MTGRGEVLDTDCPLCGKTMQPWLHVPGDWQLPSSERTFDIYWCADDQFGKVLPTPSPEVMKIHYDVNDYYTRRSQSSEEVDTALSTPSLISKIAFRFDRGLEDSNGYIAKRLGPKPKKILEIGCGNGDKIKSLSQYGHACTGIEPDPNCFSRQPDFDLRVVDGTAEDPPRSLAGEKFDAVIMNHVLEHTRDPIRAIKNAKNFLTPNGFTFFEVPNIQCVAAQLSPLTWAHLDVPRHLNHFTDKSLRTTVQKAWLTLDFIAFAHFSRQFNREWAEFGRRVRNYYDGIEQRSRLGSAFYWTTLAMSAFSSKAKKYDSIIAVARKA